MDHVNNHYSVYQFYSMYLIFSYLFFMVLKLLIFWRMNLSRQSDQHCIRLRHNLVMNTAHKSRDFYKVPIQFCCIDMVISFMQWWRVWIIRYPMQQFKLMLYAQFKIIYAMTVWYGVERPHYTFSYMKHRYKRYTDIQRYNV